MIEKKLVSLNGISVGFLKKKKKRDFSFCDFSHSFTLYIRFIHKSFPHGLKRETFIQNRWFAIQKILVEELEVSACTLLNSLNLTNVGRNEGVNETETSFQAPPAV